MRRVSSRMCYDEDVEPEDLETEGERQLQNLLKHQLDTTVSLEECMAKKKCFTPSAVYKPFGEQAAGVLSLSQFQTLQDGDGEIAALRDLGLTDREIQLWQERESLVKFSGFGADPAAVQQRLRAIEEKIEERQRLLSLPQRFAGSKQLNRREMEIEKAMFQGSDRHTFLKALYYQDEQFIKDQSDPINQLEMMLLKFKNDSAGMEENPKNRPGSSTEIPSTATSEGVGFGEMTSLLLPPQSELNVPDQYENQNTKRLSVSVPIRTLPSTGTQCPQKIIQQVEAVSVEEIRRNKLSEEEIRMIPRFSNYNPGQPSRVLYLKNLNPKATLEDLFSLFVSFQQKDGPQLLFRLLTGRMKGQAFITFPSVELAMEALNLVNGYNLMGKPIIIEYGQNRSHQ
ncbi:RNA-binding protein 41 [Hypanus sabinus]|uniref:RNA-binding protein 41 n=1 Tax=Hypanus sabinus TaxID=79690 RepID=UPI0028C4B546|nr:RNA-binding protein 41 [Hypanus sabinus]